MKYKTNLALAGFLLLALFAAAQTPQPRELAAKRTTKAVKIDGLIDDEAWKDAGVMTNLIEFRPRTGVVESLKKKTKS